MGTALTLSDDHHLEGWVDVHDDALRRTPIKGVSKRNSEEDSLAVAWHVPEICL